MDDLASSYQHCDKSVISAAKSLQSGRINLDSFRDVANSATTSVTGFVAGLKSIAVNMAIFFAISTAIQLVGKAIDALIVTQDELNEKFEDSVDKYNDLKSEISSLNAELETTKDTIKQLEDLPSLTFVEQEQLTTLKETRRELERELELKNALANSRYSQTGQSAREYFNSTSNYDTGYSINRDSIGYLTGLGIIQDTGSKFGNPIEEANAQLKIYEQLVNDIKVAEERVLEAKKAENYENTTAYKQAVKELDALEKRASDVNQSLNESYTSFSEKKVYLDPIEDSGLLSSIKEFEDELYRVLSIGTSPTDKFNALWDSSEFRKYKLELENLSKTGELDSSVISSNEKYKELLDATGMSASEVASHINSIVAAAEKAGRAISASVSFEQAFNNLPINKLEEYITIANSDGFNKNNIESFAELNAIVKETGVSIDDLNSTITTIAESNGFVLSVDLIQGIQDSYDVLEEVKKSFADTQTIGLESLNKISAKYPELNTAITQYNQGLISSDELIHLLELAYEDDVESFCEAMVEKLSSDEGFWTKVIAHNEDYFTDLAEAYGVDLRNYKTLAEAKASIDAELIKKLSIGWSEYYDAIIDPLTGLATGGANFTGDENSDLLNGGHAENLQTVKQAADAYNESKKRLNEIAEKAEKLISLPDFGDMIDDDNNGSKSSSSSTKQEEIDWIARKNELLQKQHDIQEQIANDESASYNERKSALLALIEQDKERASVAAQSASEYESAWNEVVSGLRATDVSKIIHGSLEIETYDAQELANQGVVGSVEEGEKYIENLKKAIELFDLKEEALLNHKEIEKESLEHQKESIRLLREEIDYQKDLNSAMASQVNSRMDLMEAEGKYITAGSYQELIRLSQEMETLHHDNIDALYEQLELEKEGSAEYYDILAEIESVEDAIIQCQVEQENWNYQIARLPINRIQTYIDMLETIKQDAENWGAEVSVDGISLNMDQYQNLIDINAEEIDALIKQQEKLQDLLNKYDYGSDRFNELSEEIQSVQNQMSSLIQEQKEYNYAILEIPVREMSEQIENLASAKAALERSIAEDNEKGLVTTISQYESLNQLTVQQLQTLSKQRDALTGLLSVYDQNSDKYAETKDQLDNINQTISDLVIQQYQWNSEILQIPNDKLEDLNNNLQTYSSILGDSLSEMDSVLSGVIGVIEQQTDAIEEQRKASEDMYDERIERLEKEKELLTSTNNDRKLQLDYEQALYDLDRAQSQRTIQVVRDGKVVHEADQDAIRDAQTAKADAEFNLVINNLEKQIEALETEKETILEGYDEQLDKLDDVKSKWSEIADQIKQAADIAKADKFFGDGWADKVLLGTDSDIFNLFKDLYSSTSEQKESIEEQISSNERLIQMMGEFVDRYKEGSLTYDQALNNISSLIQSMEGGYSALENLSGMMNLDNILGLENITTSTQNQIDKSAELLKQYMQIVESNKQSVEGFETNWESMSESVDFTINAFNNAVDSMQSYLDVFNSNADAINENTSTWEEMKENIESQVEALKKAAEELEKLAKKTESSSSGSGSSSGKSSGGSGKNEIYLSVNGTSYLETSNGYVDKQTGNSGNTAAEVIGKYGSEKEKEDYYELRKNQISKSPQAKNEGWEKAALEALDKEMEKAGVIRYHDGIKNGPVDGKMSDDQLWNYARKIALDPLRADEVVKILQRGEGVFQPEQIRNVMQNSELVGCMSADASALGAVTNLSRNNTIDCSIGQVHLHEVKNPDEFAKAMKQTFASSMRQNFSEVFKK